MVVTSRATIRAGLIMIKTMRIVSRRVDLSILVIDFFWNKMVFPPRKKHGYGKSECNKGKRVVCRYREVMRDEHLDSDIEKYDTNSLF